mmetsp:Transcript_3132/g.5208  ORF Transcript_3132/g.5208 Transcript_3132/m.5208 type:complete len:90 (-) Transcript_3132:804-1073(-)
MLNDKVRTAIKKLLLPIFCFIHRGSCSANCAKNKTFEKKETAFHNNLPMKKKDRQESSFELLSFKPHKEGDCFLFAAGFVFFRAKVGDC